MIRKTILMAMLMAVSFTAAPATAQVITDPFVGTWIWKINVSRTGLPEFLAIQTYHGDNTITENSSLLPTLTEGPAQGIWKRDGGLYRTVFQLFVFDDKKQYAGMVRVRGNLTFIIADRMMGTFIVDFIAPDGTVELSIDSADAVGVRLKLDTLAPAVP